MIEPKEISNTFCQSIYCYYCIFHKKEKNTKNCLYWAFAQSLEKEKSNKESKERDTK